MEQKFELKISRLVTPATATQISHALRHEARDLAKAGQESMAFDIRVIAIMIEQQIQEFVEANDDG